MLDAPDTLSSEHSDTKQVVDPTDDEILNTLRELFGQVRKKPPVRQKRRHRWITKSAIWREPKNGPLGMSVGQTEDASPTVSRTAPEVLESIPMECTFSYKEDDIQPKPEGPELNRAHKDQFMHYEETAEGIEFVGFEELLNCHDTDIDSPGSLVGQGNNDEHLESCYLPKYIEGPASLRGKIDRMLPEFIEICSKKLRRKPADLPPIELTVDRDKWESF